MKRRRLAMIGLIGSLALASQAFAVNLNIGDPAPPLQVKAFLKGQPVDNFERGKVYVVEFWATWCGPCRQSIPHLTELQSKYPSVTFIGVDVWESDPNAAAPFVEKMGDQMNYRVATDADPDVEPKKGEQITGKMAKSWMEASGEEGIPAAFIIDAGGKIAWIGHPMEMEKPLEGMLKGKLNAAKLKTSRAAQIDFNEKMNALYRKESQDRKERGDAPNAPMPPSFYKSQLEYANDAIKASPEIEKTVGFVKFSSLVGLNSPEAVTYGRHLADAYFRDDFDSLNAMAWSIVDPASPKPSRELLSLASKSVERAMKLTNRKNPMIMDTQARVFFLQGKVQEACDLQSKLIELAKGTPIEKDPSVNDRLKRYKEALSKQKK